LAAQVEDETDPVALLPKVVALLFVQVNLDIFCNVSQIGFSVMAPSVYCHMRTRATSVWTLNNCFAALVCPYHELGIVLANLGIGTGAQSCFASTRQGYGSSGYSAKGFSTVPFSSHFSIPSIWAVGVNISNLDMLFFSNREGWWLFACWVSIPGSCARGVVHNPCGISFNDRAAVVFAGSCQPRGGHLFFSFSPI
jgi:hypothetical protein